MTAPLGRETQSRPRTGKEQGADGAATTATTAAHLRAVLGAGGRGQRGGEGESTREGTQLRR